MGRRSWDRAIVTIKSKTMHYKQIQKLAREHADVYAADGAEGVRARLSEAGVAPEDADQVIVALEDGDVQEAKQKPAKKAAQKTNADHEEWEVNYNARTESFDKIKLIKTVRIGEERAGRLNEVSRDTKRRYYPIGG